MENYIGRHLLIDCYRCEEGVIDTADMLIPLVSAVSERLGIDLYDTFYHEDEKEVTVSGFGEGAHVCIHSYPESNYAAIDIYLFNMDEQPTLAMSTIRDYLSPDKIRATSVKRGNIDTGLDLKPKIQSKSTTMRKMKRTGHQINAAGKKVVHFIKRSREKRGTDGPE